MSRARPMERILQDEFVTIGELVRITGMRYSTLKYYAEIGLLPFEQADARLVRRYRREDAQHRLDQIRVYKERDGLTIPQIIDKFR